MRRGFSDSKTTYNPSATKTDQPSFNNISRIQEQQIHDSQDEDYILAENYTKREADFSGRNGESQTLNFNYDVQNSPSPGTNYRLGQKVQLCCPRSAEKKQSASPRVSANARTLGRQGFNL